MDDQVSKEQPEQKDQGEDKDHLEQKDLMAMLENLDHLDHPRVDVVQKDQILNKGQLALRKS